MTKEPSPIVSQTGLSRTSRDETGTDREIGYRRKKEDQAASMSFSDHLRLMGLFLITAMAGCGGGGGSTSSPPPPSFSVGGSVNGLVGSVSLRLNDIETLRVIRTALLSSALHCLRAANFVVTRVFPPPSSISTGRYAPSATATAQWSPTSPTFRSTV